MAERFTVDEQVAGSSPVNRPYFGGLNGLSRPFLILLPTPVEYKNEHKSLYEMREGKR